MAWPMPPTGSWNPGMAMTPDMGMGAYSTDQWTALQQQNWQQWAQWQQQYAQWQSQYGEKYAEQVQAIQSMGGMPPLPPVNTAPLPAPPPPDKPPPPPPPHENNQPLYSHTSKPPPPAAPPAVPPPTGNQWKNTNQPIQNISVDKSNRSYNKEITKVPSQTVRNTQVQASAQTPTNSQSGNAEALRKLAEEERLFDIQFKQWEQEIEKWRRENENHPDKQAYKEYEQKFETCRMQLMERRKQMKLKRDRLMHNAPQAPQITNDNNKPAPVPVTTINNIPNIQKQNFNQQIHNYTENKNNNKIPFSQQAQYKPQTSYNRSNNNSIDPQDRYESYHEFSNQNQLQNEFHSENSSFLPTTDSNKGIPGLDLVPEVGKALEVNDVVDITDDNNDSQVKSQKQNQQQKGPDYSTISQGINNILGDEKIMNILSMVQGSQLPQGIINANMAMSRGQQVKVQDNVAQRERTQNNYNNQHYSNRQQNMVLERQQNMDHEMQQTMNHERQQNITHERQQNMAHERQQDIPLNRQHMPPNRQLNIPPNRQGQNYINEQDQEMNYPPLMEKNIPMQEQYYDRKDTFDGQNMRQLYDSGLHRGPPPVMRPSMPPGRPHIDRPIQQNVDYSRGLLERPPIQEVLPQLPVQPPRPKWVDEPLFTPSIIVEYEHKPLRLKARDFIDPVHMFDYNHKSKNSDLKKKDFEKEVEDLFPSTRRRPERNEREIENDRYRDPYPRDPYFKDAYSRDSISRETRFFDRRIAREDSRDDHRLPRDELREENYERSRTFDRFDERRRDDRDRYNQFDDHRDRERDRERDRDRDWERERERDRDRDWERERDRDRDWDRERDRDRYRERERDRIDRNRDFRGDVIRGGSRDRIELRKRGHSKDSELSVISKKSKDKIEKSATDANVVDKSKHLVMIDDILEMPGREMRPAKIVIVLRGPPGSGKSYLAKLIRDREAEHGGTARIMSIDDYFMQEGEIEEKDPTTGKVMKKQTLKYEYDEGSEDTYLASLNRAFKRSISGGFFSFLIYDAVNDQLKSYADIYNYARQNGFQVYVCTMDLDPQLCYRRNIHNRKLEDIQVICSRFLPTPVHHIQLDPTTLLQSASIQDVQMEDVQDEVHMEDVEEPEVETSFTSKWEKMEDAAQLARLDGTNKPLRPSQLSMEDYLQLDDWKPNTAKPGKKTVRWADIEERRQQEKLRAVGFVVGQTDWNRMTDPTMGSSALTQTKYIERVRRY